MGKDRLAYSALMRSSVTTPVIRSSVILVSVTAQLNRGNNLINRDRDGTGRRPGGVGSELDFPLTGEYGDGELAPGECVMVHYEIGLRQRRQFRFLVDIEGIAFPD